MNETPVDTLTPVDEHPVLDSNLFLLHRSNQAFVERRSNHPTLGSSLTRREQILIGTFGVCMILIYIGVVTILPVFFASLVSLAIVVAFLGLIARYGRPSHQSAGIAGWIVPGVVLHSEKIRTRDGKVRLEQLGIGYQFVAPGGLVIEGYAGGDSEHASDTMAPAPGTPVRVWFDDDGNHYLL